MSSMKIQPQVPSQTITQHPSSASQFILRSKLTKFYPDSQVTFSRASNREVVFNISSSSDFSSFAESYIRCKVTCTLNNGGVDDTSKYLAEGGIHSCIERLEIYTRAGVLIERLDDYNKLYSLVSSASMTQEFVDNSLQDAADSVEGVSESLEIGFPLTYTTAAYTNATRTWALTGGAATTQLVVGDVVEAKTTAGVFRYIVATRADANTFTVFAASGADIADAAVVSLTKLTRQPSAVSQPTRQKAANTASYKVCFQPFSPFLLNGNYIPLFLIRGGLRIVLTLAEPAYALVSGSPPISPGFAGANVVISNPEYMVQMYQPDESLSAKYLEMYNAGELHYFFPIYRHFLDIISGVSANINHHINMRSVKAILTKIQDSRANTITDGSVNSGKNTFTCDSVAQGLKAFLKSYQYTIGSMNFPDSTPTDVENDDGHSEVLCELKRTMGQLSLVNVAGKRFYPHQWRREVGTYSREAGGRTDAQRLILSAMTERDSTPFSGIDASLVPIQAKYEFTDAYELTDEDGSSNAASDNKYIHSWVMADCVLTISSSGIVRRS